MLSSPSLFSPPSIAITDATIWIFFAFMAAIWAVSAPILEYHWENYGMNDQKISHARFIFRSGSFFIILVMFLATLSFSLS
jgi:hypothetical protein